MSKFKVGDRVKYTGDYFCGIEVDDYGEVIGLSDRYTHVKFSATVPYPCYEAELELVEVSDEP